MTYVLTVYAHGLPFLQYFSESVRERFCRVSHNLPREDISDGVHNYRRFRLTIVSFQLRKVLKTETDRYLVTSSRGNEIIEPLEVYGR